MTHLTYTILTAAILAGAQSGRGERNRRERVYAATYAWLATLGSVFTGAWLMHFIHG